MNKYVAPLAAIVIGIFRKLNLKERVKEWIKTLISNYRAVMAVIFFVILISIINTFDKTEPTIIQNLLFCTPDQVLVFLTIVGVLVGLFVFRINKFQETHGNIVLIILCSLTFFLLAPIPTLFSWASMIIVIIFYYVIWTERKQFKFSEKHVIGFFLFLIAYFVAGATGNACFYMNIGLEAGGIDTTNYFPYDSLITMVGVFGQPEQFPGVNCDVSFIKINKIDNDTVEVSIMKNITGIQKNTRLRVWEHLTLCCFKWKLLDIEDEITKWRMYDLYDPFCGIQNIFSVKGVYRTELT